MSSKRFNLKLSSHIPLVAIAWLFISLVTASSAHAAIGNANYAARFCNGSGYPKGTEIQNGTASFNALASYARQTFSSPDWANPNGVTDPMDGHHWENIYNTQHLSSGFDRGNNCGDDGGTYNYGGGGNNLSFNNPGYFVRAKQQDDIHYVVTDRSLVKVHPAYLNLALYSVSFIGNWKTNLNALTRNGNEQYGGIGAYTSWQNTDTTLPYFSRWDSSPSIDYTYSVAVDCQITSYAVDRNCGVGAGLACIPYNANPPQPVTSCQLRPNNTPDKSMISRAKFFTAYYHEAQEPNVYVDNNVSTYDDFTWTWGSPYMRTIGTDGPSGIGAIYRYVGSLSVGQAGVPTCSAAVGYANCPRPLPSNWCMRTAAGNDQAHPLNCSANAYYDDVIGLNSNVGEGLNRQLYLARYVDLSGNYSDAIAYRAVDYTPPAVTVTEPGQGGEITNAPIDLDYSISEGVSPLQSGMRQAQVWRRINGGAWTVLNTTTTPAGGGGNCTYSHCLIDQSDVDLGDTVDYQVCGSDNSQNVTNIGGVYGTYQEGCSSNATFTIDADLAISGQVKDPSYKGFGWVKGAFSPEGEAISTNQVKFGTISSSFDNDVTRNRLTCSTPNAPTLTGCQNVNTVPNNEVPPNLHPNGDFDTDLDGWTAGPSVTMQRDGSNDGHGGTGMMMSYRTVAAGSFTMAYFPMPEFVKANTDYVLSAWVYDTGNGTVGFSFQNFSNVSVQPVAGYPSSTALDGQWVKIAIKVNFLSDLTGEILVVSGTSNPSTGWLYTDQVSWTRGTTIQPYNDYDYEDASIPYAPKADGDPVDLSLGIATKGLKNSKWITQPSSPLIDWSVDDLVGSSYDATKPATDYLKDTVASGQVHLYPEDGGVRLGDASTTGGASPANSYVYFDGGTGTGNSGTVPTYANTTVNTLSAPDAAFTATGAVTVEGIYKFKTPRNDATDSVYQTLFSKGDYCDGAVPSICPDHAALQVLLDTQNRRVLIYYCCVGAGHTQGAVATAVNSLPDPSDGNWKHFAVTVGPGGGAPIFYADGNALANASSSGPVVGNVLYNSSAPFRIGRATYVGGPYTINQYPRPFNGWIDDVSIYNTKALTSSRISVHASTKSSPANYDTQITTDAPNHRYRLDSQGGRFTVPGTGAIVGQFYAGRSNITGKVNSGGVYKGASSKGAEGAPNGVGSFLTPLVSFGNPASLTLYKATMSAWIRQPASDKTGTTEGIISKFQQYALYLSSGKLCFIMGSAATPNACGTKDISDGRWHHVMLVFNTLGNPSNGVPAYTTRTYVDGIKELDVAGNASMSGTTHSLLIGSYYESPGGGQSSAYTCRCQIDEVRIYDRILNSESIEDDYRSWDGPANSREVKIDNTPPTVSATNAPAGNQWRNQNISLTLNATDAHSGIDEFVIDNDTGPDSVYSGSPAANKYASTYPAQARPAVSGVTHTFSLDGIFNYTAGANDNAGNNSPATGGTVRVDKTAPVDNTPVFGSDPGRYGWINTNANGTISCVDTPGGSATSSAGVGNSNAAQWKINNGTTNTAANNSAISVTTEGTVTLDTRCEDASVNLAGAAPGNISSWKNQSIRIDKTNPVADVSAPIANSTWTNSDITYTLAGTDPVNSSNSTAQSGVSRNYWRLTPVDASGTATGPTQPASGIQSAAIVDPAGGWYYNDNNDDAAHSFTRTLSTDGRFRVEMRTGDDAGNLSATDQVILWLDKTAPTDNTTAPAGWQNSPPNITITGSDALSGVDRVIYRWGGANPGAGDTTGQAGLQPNNTVVNSNTEGVRTLWTRIRDNAGNWSAWKSVTVMVDLSPPDLTVSGLINGWTNVNQTANLVATDSGSEPSGITRIEWRYTNPASGAGYADVANGQSVNPAPTPGPNYNYNLNFNLSSLDGTQRQLEARAVDVSGQTSAWKSFEVKIDKTPPPVTLAIDPNESGIYRTLQGAATDVLSGVDTGTYEVCIQADVDCDPNTPGDWSVVDQGSINEIAAPRCSNPINPTGTLNNGEYNCNLDPRRFDEPNSQGYVMIRLVVRDKAGNIGRSAAVKANVICPI